VRPASYARVDSINKLDVNSFFAQIVAVPGAMERDQPFGSKEWLMANLRFKTRKNNFLLAELHGLAFQTFPKN